MKDFGTVNPLDFSTLLPLGLYLIKNIWIWVEFFDYFFGIISNRNFSPSLEYSFFDSLFNKCLSIIYNEAFRMRQTEMDDLLMNFRAN